MSPGDLADTKALASPCQGLRFDIVGKQRTQHGRQEPILVRSREVPDEAENLSEYPVEVGALLGPDVR